jgi:hypothetical protein
MPSRPHFLPRPTSCFGLSNDALSIDGIRALVIVDLAEARPSISPAYELTDNPEEVALTWENYWLELSRAEPQRPGTAQWQMMCAMVAALAGE